MKTIIFTIAVLTASIKNIFAQIPNSGFETWMSMGTYENPNGWATANDFTTSSGVYTAEKGTPGSPGSSYLKLTSKTIGSTVVNGIAVSGAINPITLQPVAGFAYNQQPANFTGKWQHMIYGSSQGSIDVTLTRWDATMNTRIVVATANKTLTGMAMSWSNFTIPFVYSDFQAPDSCIIVLKASGSNPTNQDYLWVDNLSFTGSVAGLNEQSLFSEISLYPNPTVEKFMLNVNSKETQSISYELINLDGKILFSASADIKEGLNSFLIPTMELPKGNYIVRIISHSNTQTLPVVIQ